ncbi:MAG: hypothetical protein DRK00_06325 [Thermoprotei archaeon]|nr:MAG: hypothetical protein DRK00_06325 [Thermoprotei archaeon]
MSEELKEILDGVRKALEDLRRRIEAQEREIEELRLRVARAPPPEPPEPARIVHHWAPRRLEERVLTRPIPIRRLDRELYERVKRIAEARRLPVGEVMNEALRFYLENYDLAYLEAEKMRLANRLAEIGMPGFIQDEEIREYLKSLYMEKLEEIEERIRELRRKVEGREKA